VGQLQGLHEPVRPGIVKAADLVKRSLDLVQERPTLAHHVDHR
jgi:hypothetical protein